MIKPCFLEIVPQFCSSGLNLQFNETLVCNVWMNNSNSPFLCEQGSQVNGEERTFWGNTCSSVENAEEDGGGWESFNSQRHL